MLNNVNTKVEIGRKGEEIASNYLRNHGFLILSRNYRCRCGEIDVIAYDSQFECICFVEVKTRSQIEYGYPCEFVNCKKRQRIIRSAMIYLSKNRRYKAYPIRFDVFEVLIYRKEYYYRYIKNSFEV